LASWFVAHSQKLQRATVISGPLYLPKPDSKAAGRWKLEHALIGTAPQFVAVPTHFYKASGAFCLSPPSQNV
jgi:hypothetical protein